MGQIVIAVDPGREKCGIAVVHQEQGVVEQKVVVTSQLKMVVEELLIQHKGNQIVIGDGTSSQEAKERLEELVIKDEAVEVILVDERHSTDQARIRYWQEHPPKGWKRLIPVTMQVPPGPVDDYVAVILAERYFGKKDRK